MIEGQKLISVVVPVFQEEEVLPLFYRRATDALRRLPADYCYELLFVNDGSRDRTPALLREIQASDPAVKVLSFSRNFGHQAAITAGIDRAAGDAVVVIDADLQDPPEVILQMVEKWAEGFEVVYGTRISRAAESGFKLMTAKVFYRIINAVSDTELPLDAGDFRLVDRKVADALRSMREESRYIRGLVSWLGFTQYALPYARDARFAGETKFNVRRMVRFAVDGITSFSERPLHLSSYLGFMTTFVAFLGCTFILARKLLFPESYISGWTSLILMILFFGGVQLLCLGIVGQYLGRIYRQLKSRPLYVVREEQGFSRRDDAARGTVVPLRAGVN